MPSQLRSYRQPATPPHTDTPEGQRIVDWAQKSFGSNILRINSPSEVRLEQNHTPPVKPDIGMVAYADGTNWNPGNGPGPYYFGADSLWHPAFGTGGSSIAGVSSWNGRAGAVTFTLVDGTSVGLAPIASPAFTGTPTAPTPPAADNSQALATTAWVKSQGYGSGGGGASHVTISDVAPSAPIVGDLWWDSVHGELYIFYGDPTSSEWVVANNNPGPQGPPGSPGAAIVAIGPTPPSSPVPGQLWWDSVGGQLYLYYQDPTGPPQWVAAANMTGH
jgi:hypothetical protein